MKEQYEKAPVLDALVIDCGLTRSRFDMTAQVQIKIKQWIKSESIMKITDMHNIDDRLIIIGKRSTIISWSVGKE